MHLGFVKIVWWDLEKMWMGHAHKDLTNQYAEQLGEDVKYRREWCERDLSSRDA